ncbi:MAG: hypothetical protein AAF447_05740 [Myxococcota bacterium]
MPRSLHNSNGHAGSYALLATLTLGVLSACVVDDTPRGLDDRPPLEDMFFDEPVSLFPRDVAADVDAVPGTRSCTALEDGESLVAVSPSGEAWLSRAVPGGVALRVVAPAAEPVSLGRLAVEGPLAQGRAWEDGTLAFIAEERLYRYGGGLLEPIRWPAGLPAPSGFCGDPGLDGGDTFVAAGTRLFQRDEGQWFEWALPSEGTYASYGTLGLFAAPEGACRSQEDALYVSNVDGRVWFVARWKTEPVAALDGATSLAHDPAFGVAALVGGELRSGGTPLIPEIEATRFAEGAPEALAASDRTVYVRVGSTLYRGRDGAFMRVQGATVAGELRAYAGGVVFTDAGELCHAQVGARVTMLGLRPFERLLEGSFQLRVTSDGLSAPTLELDDEPLALTPADLGFETAATPTGSQGWHRLRVLSGADDRTLRYLVRPPPATWESDIRELSATHCSSNRACHASDRSDMERPDLSDWEGWVMNADIIRTRLVETGDMPPAESRQPTWGPGVLTTLLRWIDGGLPEGGAEE